MYRYYKRIAGVHSGNYIYFWKSKGLSDERINYITASNYRITPELSYYGSKIRVVKKKSIKVVQNKIKLHILVEKQ